MKLKTLFILLFTVGLFSSSWSQSYDWALTTNSASFDIFYDTVVDEEEGKIFTVGLISDQSDNSLISSNVGSAESFSHSGEYLGDAEGILICTDLDGNLLWQLAVTSEKDDAITGVDVMDNGDVVITGYFEHESAKIIALNGEFELTPAEANDNADAFYAKINNEGELLDVQTFGSEDNDIGIDVKAAGDAYYVLIENDVTSSDQASRKLLRIDSSNNMEWQAEIHLTDSFSVDFSLSEVACLAVQNEQVFVFGSYRESVYRYTDGTGDTHSYSWSFDSNQLDFFVLALNADGSEKWAQEIEQGSDVSYGYGIDADCSGLYLTGTGHASFLNPMVFPDGVFLNDFDHDDIWVCGLDLETGNANWAKGINSYSGTHNEIGFGISCDGLGNIYVTGVHQTELYVDGFELPHNQGQDFFVVGMNNGGDVNWMLSLQSTNDDIGCALDAYSNDKLVVAGMGGPGFSFNSNFLSMEDDNGLLMGLTVVENTGMLCCTLDGISLSSSTNQICEGETTVLESSEFVEGLVLQTFTGSGWIDFQNLTGNQISLQPTEDTSYRLIHNNASCSFTSNVVNVAVLDPIVISETTIAASCGLSNGSISTSVIGGSGNYTYNWTPIGLTGTGTNAVGNLAGGNYTLNVSDDAGCSTSTTFTVPVISALSVDNINAATAQCNGGSDGTIALSISGGVGDVSVDWDNGQSGTSISGLNAGTYSYVISDESTCTLIGDVTLGEQSAIALDNLVVNDVDCLENSNGSIGGTLAGGQMPYALELTQISHALGGALTTVSAVTAGATGNFTFNGLSGGEYLFSVTDDNNCVFSESIEISSQDTSAPIFSCLSNQTADSDINCSYTLPDYSSGLTISDDCGFTIDQIPAPNTELLTGTHTIQLIATDASGNENLCEFLLRVEDNTDPLIVAPTQPFTAEVNQNCEAVVPDYTSMISATDNCGIASVSQSPLPGEVRTGDFTLIFNVSDVNGNSSLMSFEVELIDTISPTYTSNFPSGFEVNDGCDYLLEDLSSFILASDNCSATTVTQITAIGTALSTGVHSIDFLIEDENGNSVNCSHNINVNDHEVPVVSVDAPFIFEINNGCQWLVEDLRANVVANDNCGIQSIVQTPAIGELLDIGLSQMDFLVTDLSGNEIHVQQEISIQDLTAPILVNQTTPDRVMAGSNCGWILSDLTNTLQGTDNCGDVVVVQIPLPGTVLGIGDHTIEFYLFDTSTNSTQIDHQISVDYGLAPSVTISAPSIYDTNSGCDYILEDLRSFVSADNTCSTSSIEQSPAVGTALELGTHTITFTATDEYDNTASFDHEIEVVDAEDPVINCIPEIILDAQVNCAALIPQFEFSDFNASDNCSLSTIDQSVVAGTEITASTIVEVRVSDAAGNVVVCAVDVRVVDTTPPVVNCETIILDLENDCAVSMPDLSLENWFSDNCEVDQVTQSILAGTPLSVGIHNVEVTATDQEGLSTSCDLQIIIQDTVGPDITCPDEFTLETTGTACGTSAGNLIAALEVSSTACDLNTIAQDIEEDFFIQIGDQDVVFTASDGQGNSSTCSTLVHVVDVVAPIITCPGSIVINESAACNYVLPNLIDLPSIEVEEACSFELTQSLPEGTELQENTAVQIFATDPSGNQVFCTVNVLLEDSQAPQVLSSENVTVEVEESCAFILDDWSEIIDVADCNSNLSILGNATIGQTFTIGDHTILLSITDEALNETLFNINLHVVDTEAPIVNCPTVIMEINLDQNCSIQEPIWEDLISVSDNCSVDFNVINVNDLGNKLFSYEIEISDGTNSSFCSVLVQGIDATPPVLDNCPASMNVDFISNCEFVLPDYREQIAASDGCTSADELVITQTPPSGTAIAAATEVSIVVTDQSLLSTSCSFTITPLDLSPPEIITCVADQQLPAIDCIATLPDLTGDLVATDNCTYSIEQTPAAGTVLELGDHVLVFKVSDGVNEEVTCSSIISVVDTQSPLLIDISEDLYFTNNDCQFILGSWESLIEVTDCSDVNVAMNPEEGTVLNAGSHEVTFTVSDDLNEASVLTVEFDLFDNLTWTLDECPSNSELILNSQCEVVLPDYASEIQTTLSCGIELEIEQFPPAGTVISGVQELEVDFTISGNDGVQETCSFLVTILDDSAPEMLCSDITLPAISCSGFMPDVEEFNWAEDLCTEVSYSQSIPIGDALEIGQHFLSVQAFGGGDLPATCEVQVIVVDEQAPSADCSALDLMIIESSCEYSFEDFTDLIQYDDNCVENVSVTQHFQDQPNSNIGQVVSEGTYTIEFVVSDGMNATSCSAEVQVVNTQQASLTCSSSVSVELTEGDACAKVVEFQNPQIQGGCGDVELIQTAGLPSGSEFPVGSTTNTFELIENSNVIASCSFEVTVIDMVIPAITCPEAITSCNPIVFFEMPEAADNCQLVTVEQVSNLDLVSGSSFPIGTTSILFKAIDPAGNWDTCELTIEIVESVTPEWEALNPSYCFDHPTIDLLDFVEFPGSISWSTNVGNGLLVPSEIGLGSHEITLTAEHNGCSTELSQTVEILALPDATIEADNEVCGMQTELFVTGNADAYNWELPNGVISANNSSSSIQDVLAEEEGLYSFTVTAESNGCVSTSSTSVQFWEQPGIPDAGPDQQLAVANSQLNGSFNGVGEIFWDSNSESIFIDEVNSLSSNVSNLAIGWNELVLYQSNGSCPVNSDTLRIKVLQLEIPTGFSPNGDNVNDVFHVTGLEQYADVQLVVFNRWGNEVYKSLEYKNGWDGSNNNGNLLEEDTYYIVLTLDDEEYKGYVVIKK